MAALAVKYGAGYVVMHNPCGSAAVAEYEQGIVEEVRKFFLDALTLAGKCGLPKSRLCLDMGFGFGKSYNDNLEILRNMQWLRFKGIALLAACSRKRFIGEASGEKNSALRDSGTVAANTAAIMGGADIIRLILCGLSLVLEPFCAIVPYSLLMRAGLNTEVSTSTFSSLKRNARAFRHRSIRLVLSLLFAKFT